MMEKFKERLGMNPYLKTTYTLLIFLVAICGIRLNAQAIQMDQLGDLSNLGQALQSESENEPMLSEDEFENEQIMDLRNIKDKCRLRDEISLAKYSIICQQIEELENRNQVKKPKDFKFIVQQKNLDQNLKLFGYELFVDSPTTFIQSSKIPVPTDYLLGPGDNLKIILYGSENRSFTNQITREGDILLPGLGPISIAGLTFNDAKDLILNKIENETVGVEASISMGALRTIDIYILGNAYQPGVYNVSALSTITNALFSSGGINESASLRNIQLKRQGEVISNLDFYDLLLKGDNSNDLRLQNGDVIFIPSIIPEAIITAQF